MSSDAPTLSASASGSSLPASKPRKKYTIYPAPEQTASELSNEQIATLIAPVAVFDYDWFDSKRKISKEERCQITVKNLISLMEPGRSHDPRITCDILHGWYKEGVHESLIVSFAMRLGFKPEKEIRYFTEHDWDSKEGEVSCDCIRVTHKSSSNETTSTHFLIPKCSADGIHYNFRYWTSQRYVHDAAGKKAMQNEGSSSEEDDGGADAE